jgi:hypothetical protein
MRAADGCMLIIETFEHGTARRCSCETSNGASASAKNLPFMLVSGEIGMIGARRALARIQPRCTAQILLPNGSRR